jgi:hypothetical protein
MRDANWILLQVGKQHALWMSVRMPLELKRRKMKNELV